NPVNNRPFGGGPAWFGCDEGPSTPSPFTPDALGENATFPNVTNTCTLNLDTGRGVCLGTTDPHDGGGTWACSVFYAENPRVRIPLGVTNLQTVSSTPASPSSVIGEPAFDPCALLTNKDL